MTTRLAGLTGATLETAPTVCQSCVWWQSRGNREPDKRKWVDRAEGEWGAWGTIYRDDDGDRKSTRLNSSHIQKSRMPSSA